MSDTTTEAPRNDAGQFQSTEPAYGREGLERAAGYVPLPDESKEETPDDLTVKEAAENRLRELSGSESKIITHAAGLPDNVTMTLDQAADALADARGADDAQAEIDGKKAAQKEVDKLRGEKPEAKAPQIETEDDVERALKSPKIRDAIAERVTAADTQRAHYEAAVADAGKFAIASLLGDFPEFADVPLDRWANEINAMHQREPARARLMVNKLQALGRVEAAQQQIKAQKTAREQTEFKAYAAKEDARFAEMTRGIPAKEMAAIEAHVPKMLAEHGADVKQFLEAVSNQTTFPRASAEALLVKAARYDLMMKNAKLPRAVPPVPTMQRPGYSGPRTNSGDANLAALNAKLNQSGNLKDAAKLLAARRSKGR